MLAYLSINAAANDNIGVCRIESETDYIIWCIQKELRMYGIGSWPENYQGLSWAYVETVLHSFFYG